MASMTLSTCSKNDADREVAFARSQRRRLAILSWFAAALAMLFAPYATAANTSGLCEFAKFLKDVATGGAIIAIVLFVINSFFIKSSVVGDIIMYVIIGCVVVAIAPEVVTMTGLTTSCSF